jgi:radical SAM protein with 4Fe4S-binding SPASM domain
VNERAQIWLRMQLKPERVSPSAVKGAAVDPGSICNLRCPFCATGNGSLALSKEFLQQRDFDTVLERLPALKSLALYQWGEPLLNPAIHGMIEAAAAKGTDVVISTHLSLKDFDAAAARRLVTSGLVRLIVSCDGASQRTYQRYRVGGDFNLVMRNLKLLLAAKSELKLTKPRIDWQFLVHRGNQHEIGKASRLAKKLGVGLIFEKLGIPAERQRAWSPDPGILRKVPQEKRRSPRRGWDDRPDKWPSICLQAWDMPVIHSDGTVLPCCVVSDRRHGLGNIFKEPFEKIWNKPLIVAMRRYLKSGTKSARKLPCYGCPHDPNAPDSGQ